MKISLILATLLASAVSSVVLADDGYEDAAQYFKLGVSVGVDAVEREFRVQGWKKEEVTALDYMVVLDCKNISTKQLLILKDAAFKKGLVPVELTNGMLLYKSFGNKPDADELVSNMNSGVLKDVNMQSYVYKKRRDEKFEKAPFAFKYIFDQMQKDIKDNVKVVVLDPVQARKYGVAPQPVVESPKITQPEPEVKPMPAQPVVEVKPAESIQAPAMPIVSAVSNTAVKKPANTKAVVNNSVKTTEKTVIKASAIHTTPFRLKNGSVEYFSYSRSDGDADGLSKTYAAELFKHSAVLKNKGQVFNASGIVVSSNGMKYVKVAGKNMYFDAYDTSLGGQ